jgi:hypothetical protein
VIRNAHADESGLHMDDAVERNDPGNLAMEHEGLIDRNVRPHPSAAHPEIQLIITTLIKGRLAMRGNCGGQG